MVELDDHCNNNRLTPQILDISTSELVKEALEGLQSNPKYLNLNHFKDNNRFDLLDTKHKDVLERKIGSPNDVLTSYKEILVNLLTHKEKFRLIEIGLENTLLSKAIVEALWKAKTQFEFVPISYSKNALKYYIADIWTKYPLLSIFPLVGDYFEILSDFKLDSTKKVLILGNLFEKLSPDNDMSLQLQQFSKILNSGDIIQFEFNIKNDPRLIANNNNNLKYNDIIKNKIVELLNETLSGDFTPSNFFYFPLYDPEKGEYRSYLVSTKKQIIHLSLVGKNIPLNAWESIAFETSKKYDKDEIGRLAKVYNFTPILHIDDLNDFSCSEFWQKD